VKRHQPRPGPRVPIVCPQCGRQGYTNVGFVLAVFCANCEAMGQASGYVIDWERVAEQPVWRRE